MKLLFSFGALICVAGAWSQTYPNVQVVSTDNLSGAGNPTNSTPNPGGGSGGTAAHAYSLDDGLSRVMTFQSVTGDISLSSPFVRTLPDGIQADNTAPFGISMSVDSFDSISGISLDKGSGFLAGVFLGPAYPGAAPADLHFVNSLGSSSGIDVSFTDLSPLIGQIFFIGDGLTGNGSGAIQNFHVPDGATRLFLGVTDAGGYSGPSGQFQDNDGHFNISFEVVPEPSSILVIGAGLAYILKRRSRK